MTFAIYPGTFDPITNGHVDIVRRAAGIFPTVLVAVAASEKKRPLLSLEERLELARIVVKPFPNVEVKSFSGLLKDLVRAEGEFPEHILAKLRKGVEIDGVKTKRSKVKLLEQGEKEAKLLVTITEGRNRQVRRMFEAVERNVVFLKRVAIGDLRLGGLARGAWRYLREEEVEYLKRF